MASSATPTDPIPSMISSLVQVLQSEGSKVTGHQLQKNAITLGNNFCAGIAKLRVQLERADGSSEEKSFVLKIPNQSPFYDQLSALKMYQNEVIMYSHILPAMSKLGANCNLTAKSYLPSGSGDNLALDDLNVSGYTLMDKKKQLDLAHSKLALEALAKLHALSVKLHEISKETLEMIIIPPRESPKDTGPSAIFEKFDNTVAVLDLPDEIFAKVQKFVKNFTAVTFNDTLLPNENFNVLCHGDYWLGNMLFQHNQQNVAVDVKMVDFQMVHWCSPAIDLIEFFVTSVKVDVYMSNRDALIEFYLGTLNRLIESLGSPVKYSRDELDYDIRRYKLFHLYNLGPYLSAVLSDQEDPFNQSGKDTTIYTSPLYKDALRKWILYLNDEDLL